MSGDKKRCSKCQRELPNTSEYFTWTSSKGSRYLRADCKECRNLGSDAHYQANMVQISERVKRYRAEHREEERLRDKRNRLKRRFR